MVFDYVRQRIYAGLPPLLSEIAEHFQFSRPNAFQILRVLERKGYLKMKTGIPRAIFLLPPYQKDTRCTLIAAAPVPGTDIQKGDFVHVDTAAKKLSGAMIVTYQGDIKKWTAGDKVYGKVNGISREV